jgi:hypothetical protein
VTFPGSVVFCDGNNASAFIRHSVALGVYCDASPDPLYIYRDVYFECAETSHQFEVFADVTAYYSCSESATFPAGSSSANTQIIPSVAVITDAYWLSDPSASCFTLSKAEAAPTAPATPPITRNTNLPTSVPTSLLIVVSESPTSRPTFVSDAPPSSSSSPTVAKTVVPSNQRNNSSRMEPTAPRETSPTIALPPTADSGSSAAMNSSASSPMMDPFIGGVVAGFLIFAI